MLHLFRRWRRPRLLDPRNCAVPAVGPGRAGPFTRRAKRVLHLATQEARRLDHDYLGTEHILLGLLREGEGLGAQALTHLGVTLPLARAAVAARVGPGDRAVTGALAVTPRAKRAILLAGGEARRRQHPYVGTEHLLLGLLRDGEGIGVRVLADLGLLPTAVDRQVETLLREHGAR